MPIAWADLGNLKGGLLPDDFATNLGKALYFTTPIVEEALARAGAMELFLALFLFYDMLFFRQVTNTSSSF